MAFVLDNSFSSVISEKCQFLQRWLCRYFSFSIFLSVSCTWNPKYQMDSGQDGSNWVWGGAIALFFHPQYGRTSGYFKSRAGFCHFEKCWTALSVGYFFAVLFCGLLDCESTSARFGSVTQSCLTLCDPMDNSPLGSSVHGILQARIPEWVAMPSSRGPSPSRDPIHLSNVSCIYRHVLFH